eukprot:TRINITY_DN13846_c0_g1_i1.p1 TRINITY_DN13846_c0_g1~~TRINITY_DN13846_c0_g1_i1.p1  ORF type:complete len:365 (-),score=87.10 TRINITY_DN13846_c0_g1_i1:402-1496(-)
MPDDSAGKAAAEEVAAQTRKVAPDAGELESGHLGPPGYVWYYCREDGKLSEQIPLPNGSAKVPQQSPLPVPWFWDRLFCRPCCSMEDDCGNPLAERRTTDRVLGPGARRVLSSPESDEHLGDCLELAATEEKPEQECGGGVLYRGQWCGTHFHGEGVLKRGDGSTYEGQLRESVAHGHGSFSSEFGRYEGQWEHDRAHGFGKFTHSSGSVYTGEWQGDTKHGHGTELLCGGAKYDGQFVQGHKHGSGSFYAEDGRLVYMGKVRDDKMHGEGTYNFPCGRVYTGQWQDNEMYGTGRFSFPDGSYYSGGLKSGLRHGPGTFIWASGERYSCTWDAGKPLEGTGIFLQADGKPAESAAATEAVATAV